MLFVCHYPQDLIEKHIKIRIQQVKSRKSSKVDTDTQSEIFYKNNTIVLPYFGPISNTIQFMLSKDVLNRFEKSGVAYELICKKCKVTYVGQTGRFLNARVEEHKKNLGRKCNYHNVLSDHRKEYANHDFDWNNVEILNSESNKGKREFMDMLYMKRARTYSIHLKID